MVRDNANDFNSNPHSTPIEVFQHNRFREGYFKEPSPPPRPAGMEIGVESDNMFLNENFSYIITDPTQFDPGTPLTFALPANRPDLEQSAFVQDLIRLGNWTINAGLRWDHYQLLLNGRRVNHASPSRAISPPPISSCISPTTGFFRRRLSRTSCFPVQRQSSPWTRAFSGYRCNLRKETTTKGA